MNYELESCSDVCASANSRIFFTREEKINMLEEYKKNLERETQGVAERIKELIK